HDTGEWTEISSVVQSEEPRSAKLEVDLEQAASELLQALGSSDSRSEQADNCFPKARLTTYLEVEGPASVIPGSAQRWATDHTRSDSGKLTDRTTFGPSKESDTVRGFITLGRFVHTVLPRFSAVQIDGHQLTPYVTKKGNIAFALNHPLPPFMRVHVDELTVG